MHVTMLFVWTKEDSMAMSNEKKKVPKSLKECSIVG